MNLRFSSFLFAGILLFAVDAHAGQAASPEQALLDQYCITCHNQRAASPPAGLALDARDLDDVARDAADWERVVRKVSAGMMPPAGAQRPEREQLDAFVAVLEERLDRAAALDPNPGAPGLHRLNRTEYANAIRDLLDLNVDVTTLLPADDASEGFDNIADSLGVSPSLIQGYVSAAMKISRLAVGDMTLLPYRTDYPAPPNLVQDTHIEGLPLGTLGGMVIEHTFPLDAQYQVSAGGASDILIDGEPPASAAPAGGRGGRGGGPGGPGGLGGLGGRGGRGGGARITVTAGPHTIAAASVERRRSGGVDGIYSAPVTARGLTSISINGPYDATGPGDTPSRRRIFVCYPDSAQQEAPCAREIFSTIATRAFRQPVTESELDSMMRFYEQGRTQELDGSFEIGVQQGVARILVAPKFLYRFEAEPEELADGAVYSLSDLELASRLSFFLWSTIPDDELLELAMAGELRDAAVFDRQVDRMLEDPRSEALLDNFASQWLQLRQLAQVQPELGDFDDNLRYSMIREAELMFEGLLREDRSVLELLDADYTFVDERLAKHYGIPEIRGSYFRRISLPEDSIRRGLLGKGSVLTVTSVPTRTSPVVRGKWVLENVLGVPAPEPPPGVETNLEPDPEVEEASSLRQRLEAHRSNPVCSSCHRIMDPIGLALENFDLTGQWRENDDGVAIDASGVLVDGTALDGPIALRVALASRSDVFVTAMTEKLMMYALGRPVEYYDMPTVRSIVRDARENDYRFSSLILGIARSQPFQMRIKGGTGAEAGEE